MTSSLRPGSIATFGKFLLVCLFACCAAEQSRANMAKKFAQLWEHSDSTPHPAVVRVTMVEPDGFSQGSGTLIDRSGEYGLVITNWHVVRDGGDEICVQFPDGFQSEAQLLKVDEDWDLAALAIWRPPTPPMPLATEVPQPGEPLTIAGYGQSGKFRAAHGLCTQYVSPGINLPFEMVETSVTARQGDSGGPMINQHGELAGVLFGSSTGVTSGSYIGRVRRFLESVQGHIRQNMQNTSDKLARAEPESDPCIPLESRLTELEGTSPSTLGGQPNGSSNSQTMKASSILHLRDVGENARVALAETELVPASQGDSNWQAHAALAHLQPVLPQVQADRVLPMNSVPTRPVEVITLDQLAGSTVWNKAKSLFAVVGLLTLLNQTSKLTGQR